MYRKTKLSEEELQEIRENLRTKGVIKRRMNPKGMTLEEMFGTYDALSHEWREGLFSQEFRSFANMADDKKKWILLDGPIDYSWVENLNSILDDNRKMGLPNGEQIKMSQGMCILLETDNMKNAKQKKSNLENKNPSIQSTRQAPRAAGLQSEKC